jgi:predicted AlkP superfamily phosphohydrolase/phosphomutase
MKRALPVFLASWLFASAACAADVPSVVVLGIDGMDPDMLTRFVAEGHMPNFKALIDEGSFVKLETSIPPQSPVAWSNFITGMDPGGHGIFDFIHRDPVSYMPIFSAADIKEPSRVISFDDWTLPLAGGGTVLLRKGEAFWQILEKHGVPCTVIRVPANYPPADTKQKTLAGMGTPDLLGSYGTFSYYTDDTSWAGASVAGGRATVVTITDDRFTATLEGPRNSLRKSQPTLECPFTVDVDRPNDAIRIRTGSEDVFLHSGEWSRWVPVEFELMGPFKKLHGMCRFHLRSVSPALELYASPINIDPSNPALPLSTPEDYVKELSDRIGRFYTQGIAEDTKALEAGALGDSEFVAQTDTIYSERDRMLDVLLHDYHGGLLFFYVSTIDQSCHALWRDVDPAHPAHKDNNGFEDRFLVLYEEMDAMLGKVRAHIPKDATLIVLSDHGFAPYYKKVNLNGWLFENGYLSLIRPDEAGKHPLFGNVFWRRTRAYAVGINGLYVNLAGRESRGVVPPGPQYDALVDELRQKLLAIRDPETGAQVITAVDKASEVYHGPEAKNGPDLIVGYNRGYRSSDDSALGTITTPLLVPNMGKWTGDHCMDHNLVPGVLLSNHPIAATAPALYDIPVSILALYGVAPLPEMRGHDVFSSAGGAGATH